jgi:DNA polymerase III subunit beta
MQAVFAVAGLKSALATVMPVVPKKSPQPILQAVKMVCSETESKLIANNLDQSISYTIAGGTVSEAGEILLSPDRLKRILDRLGTDTEIEIRTNESKVIVTAKSGKWNLISQDPVRFPSPEEPNFEKLRGLCVDMNELQKAIDKTIVCTDPESTRYALSGVLFEPDHIKKELRLVATDGRRLVLATLDNAQITHELDGHIEFTTVVPAKAMQILSKIKGEEFCDIAITGKNAYFRTSQAVICTRLVEGRFPKYQDVIPQTSGTVVKTLSEQFCEAVSRASILTSEESRAVKMSFQSDSGLCMLTARSADAGDAATTCEVVAVGDAVDISIDPNYLLPVLEKITSPIEIRLTNSKSAMLIKSPNCDVVIMPLTPEK